MAWFAPFHGTVDAVLCHILHMAVLAVCQRQQAHICVTAQSQAIIKCVQHNGKFVEPKREITWTPQNTTAGLAYTVTPIFVGVNGYVGSMRQAHNHKCVPKKARQMWV